jgi:hypothetical protein
VFPVWTEWTNIARRLMNKTVSYHLIFALETFAAFASRAIFHWTIVRSVGRVYICM